MITLANDYLTVQIDQKGAEIRSVIDNKTGYEFMWQQENDYWNRTAPVLFPIVGTLKDNTYYYKETAYQLPRHGFARDLDFEVQTVTDNSATFYVKDGDGKEGTVDTLSSYPFEFSFQISYVLYENQITITYELLNPSSHETIYYSVGGHPAFNITTDEKGDFKEAAIAFEPSGPYLKYPLTKEGLLNRKEERYVPCDLRLLTRKDFQDDAWVFLTGEETTAVLKDYCENVEIRMNWSRMPFFGVWTPYDQPAGFICLEPWAGVADVVGTNQQLVNKYGIEQLAPRNVATHDYTMTFTKK